MQRKISVFGFEGMICDKEGPTKWEDALSPSNELCSLQKVSPERTTRKSEAAEQRRYEVAGFSSLKEENFSWHRIKKSVISGTIGEVLYI